MMNDNNDKKRPLTYYYMLMLVLILVFNSVIMPMFFNPKMKEVSYNNFLQMVDEGKVSKVEITDKRLAAVDKNNEKEIYVTGRVEDPELANRLMKSKVEFTQVVPKEQSPLVTFFTNWVLPILIFFGLGQLFMYFMGKRMGGNAMSFGKSNAKVYVEAQTGKSFADVAGQDEAKEALMELVDFLIESGSKLRLCLCNDMTKLHEMSFRGTPAQVKEQLLAKGNYDKGEYAIVAEVEPEYQFTKVEHTVSAEAMLVDAMISGGVSGRDAIAAVLADPNNSYSKNELKAAALNLKRMFE